MKTTSVALPIALFLASACGSKQPPTGTTTGEVKGQKDEAPSQSYGRDPGRDQAMCGGIAGFVCPEGQKCLMHETYPDAAGVCVGQPEEKGWKDRCATVRCMALECPAGFKRHFTPQSCCGRCIPDPKADPPPAEGSCKTPEDCNDLPHIMCVGSWSCTGGTCDYNCGVTTIE
jgi:hypothetical protein